MKKKLFSFLLSLLALGICTSDYCGHVHTEECGEDGVNCVHVCEDVEGYGFERPHG